MRKNIIHARKTFHVLDSLKIFPIGFDLLKSTAAKIDWLGSEAGALFLDQVDYALNNNQTYVKIYFIS
jgi:hypothetical protein